MEVECLPSEVPGVSWFEFLLDESLLERHLNSNGDSSATELIAVFLYQVNIATSTAKEIVNKETATGSNGSAESTNGTTESRPSGGNGAMIENKKIKLLKLLALKVACHLRWNINILGASLPLAIQQSLLWELMSVFSSTNHGTAPVGTSDSKGASDSIDLTSANHAELDLSSLSADQLFAVLMYHQWCLMTKVQECFPRKPVKASNIQVPGLLDPNAMFANMKDGILKMLRENVDKSLALLERYLTWVGTSSADLRMPTISCFGKVVDDSSELNHDWSNGLTIEPADMTSQVWFTVGTMYFSQCDFKKAYDAFSQCRNSLNQVQTAVLGSLDKSRLDGYFVACSSLVPSAHQELTSSSSLYTRVLASIRNNFKDLTALLIEDIVKQELSTTYRASLEEKTHSATRTDSLYEEVLVCNSLRCCLRSGSGVYNLVSALNRTVGLSDFCVKVCLGVHKTLPPDQRENLRMLLRHLSLNLRANEEFMQKILESELIEHFTVEDKDALLKATTRNPPSVNVDLSLNFPLPGNENVKLAEMERELLTTYDVQTVRNIVQDIADKIGILQTIFLSDTWRIPFELHKLVEGLPLPEPYLPPFVHVLIAKSRICIKLQHYDQARELLLAADSTVRDVSYKLSKLLRWELLAVDLQRYADTGSASADISLQDLVKKSKSCIVSLNMEQDIQPSMDIMCIVVVFLLNCSEFEYLAGVNDVNSNGYMQFGQIVSLLCKELPMINKARSAARNFIDSVQLSFKSNTEAKRAAVPGLTMPGGAAALASNGEILTQDLLAGFVCKLKEPMVLSVFISCFTKLLALSRNDISEEMFSDYTMLWPTTLALLDEVAISEMVGSLMHHALSVNPLNPSWLRTQADLHYVQGQFWLALKYYLHVGVVNTDFFSEPITKNVYDDQVYKRMIRCCTNLGCHTQAAVLCQMYDDADYTVAFKSLQERVTNDSMDTYYEFFWDSTILEYLINLHARRGEVTKRQYAMQLIGQLELNSSNRAEILQEAARVRKARFFRALARQYMGVELLAK